MSWKKEVQLKRFAMSNPQLVCQMASRIPTMRSYFIISIQCKWQEMIYGRGVEGNCVSWMGRDERNVVSD